MRRDQHSAVSNETTMLDKLGVEIQEDRKQNLASVINRILVSNSFLSDFMIIIQFIQAIFISLAPTIEGFLKNAKNLRFLDSLFTYLLHPALKTNNPKTVNLYILIITAIIDAIWIILFIFFSIEFKRKKTFSQPIVKAIFYIGNNIIRIIGPTIMSSVTYFFSALYRHNGDSDTIYALFSIITAIATYVIQLYITDIIISSPDVDVNNKTSVWPLSENDLTYRIATLFFLPFFIELFRDKKFQYYGAYALIIVAGIIGLIFTTVNNSFVFPTGRALIITFYTIYIIGSLLSIIFHFVGGSSYIYLAVFIVVIGATFFISDIVLKRVNRKCIDVLYLKHDDMINYITTPRECIILIHVGLVHLAPCISNKELINWMISAFGDDQQLLLVICYVYYMLNVSYGEILRTLSTAADIKPLSRKEQLLFFQIFKRLPTHEDRLTSKIESIRRMYEIPRGSLSAFWQCIMRHQWDEAITRSYNFSDDINKLNQVFTTLIFDNPSSLVVLDEYSKFAEMIQGNYLAAARARKEIEKRARMEAIAEEDMLYTGGDQGSQALSRLSSVKSSVLISAFSETIGPSDRTVANLQNAFLVRPLFSPSCFFNSFLFIALFILCGTMIIFVMAFIDSSELDKKSEISKSNHIMIHKIATALGMGMVFSSSNEAPENTLTGKPIDVDAFRKKMVDASYQFDVSLSDSIKYYSSIANALRIWVDGKVETFDSGPEINADNIKDQTVFRNISLITAVRMFQLHTLNAAFSPIEHIGTVKKPSSDLILIGYLYPAVQEVSKMLNKEVDKSISKEAGFKSLYIAIGNLAITGIVVISIIVPFVVLGFIKEYNFFVSIIQSISGKSAKSMLMLDEKNLGAKLDVAFEASNSKKKISSSLYKISRIIISFILILLINPLPLIIVAVAFVHHQTGVRFITSALHLSSDFVADFGFICLHSYRIVSGTPSPYTLEEEIVEINESASRAMRNYRELFFGGTERFPDGLVKMYPELMDKISIHKCNVINGSGRIDSTCMAFQDMIFFIFDQVNRLCSLTDSTMPKAFNTTWWRLFFPVAFSTLTQGVDDYYDMLNTISNDLKKTYSLYSTISFVASFALFFISLFYAFLFKKYILEPQIRNIIKPLMIMPPRIIAECYTLIKFLQGEFDHSSRQIGGEKGRKSKDRGSVPLIDFINEGILVVNPDGTIIGSNSKYHELIKNTAEDVLGQNIRTTLPQNVQPLFEALDMVKEGKQLQTIPAIETVLITEDNVELQARISFIYHLDENTKQTTCAFVIFDKSGLIKAQSLLRKEKENVEKLLDSILPHNIAVSLLNGKTDISFQSDKGLVLFSDLVSFTPMCSKMSAKQIMFCLNMLFTEFDNELKKYTRVTKLKTIGDAYVCATGIFEGDGPLELAAAEIVQFAIKMQRIIPQINKQYGFSLKQRVGVHCGGPLICGVLGKEKPLFEVIGATVDNAEELESTCEHCKVHISQEVAELIVDTHIKIIERTDVKVEHISAKTYTINP